MKVLSLFALTAMFSLLFLIQSSALSQIFQGMLWLMWDWKFLTGAEVILLLWRQGLIHSLWRAQLLQLLEDVIFFTF